MFKTKIYILIYFIANLFFLTQFPFVHSDESWLSGLSRQMMAVESLAVTEPFFDLYERNPHAIKSLFHVIQAGFISILGYSIFTVRLISLIFGCLCLYVFYKTLRQLAVADWFSFLTVVILSVNVQFIYASHFARQEIVILFLMLAVFLMLLKFLETLNLRFVIFAAVLTGLSIGIHPNSFVIGMASLVFLSCNIVIRRLKPAVLFVYTGVLSIFAAFFVGLSLYFDPNFFTNYAHYGHSHFDVLAPFSEKFLEMRSYFSKLYFGVSGTYYTPDIRFEFVLFGLLLTLSLFAGYKRPDIQNVWCVLIGIFLAFGIVGRYNQTYVIFLFPFIYMFLPLVLKNISDRWKSAVFGIILLITLTSSCLNITPWLKYSYTVYLDEIRSVIPAGEKTIGNLNSEYAFENGALLDYRNLTFIKANGLTVAEYVKAHNVRYIIVSDELELLQSLGWNTIYGDINFLDELNSYLGRQSELIHTFKNNTYGVRIVRFMNGNTDFYIRIYKVL